MMPYMRKEDRKPIKDAKSKPILDEDIINRQEEAAKGTINYWLCLIKFNELVKGSTSSTEDRPESQLQKMREESKCTNEYANRQRESYAENSGKIQRKKKKRELQANANYEFKCDAQRASLLKSQQTRPLFRLSQQRFVQCITNPSEAFIVAENPNGDKGDVGRR